MTSSIVLGIDLGTQQFKVIAVDYHSHKIIGSVSTKIENLSSTVGALEQNASLWWPKLCDLTKRLVSECQIEPASIAGIGFSGHMHSIIPLDEDFSPLHNCIVWADTRATDQAKRLEEIGHIRLWNPAIAAYSIPKVLWLRDKYPELFAKTRYIVFAKDYLRLLMTGVMSTDYSDASGTLAWDFGKRCWDKNLLSWLNIPITLFPEPSESTRLAGTLTERAAHEMGLVSGIPVATGAGDVAAAVIGSGVTSSSTLLINAGTAAQVILIQDAPQHYQYEDGVRYLFELGIASKVFAMGALPSAGLALEWWRTVAGNDVTYHDLDRLAQQASTDLDSVFFVPYLQGTGTPYLIDRSLGTFAQISTKTDIKAMTRAVMEGVAFGIRHCAEALFTDGALENAQVQITGGVSKSQFMRNLLASVFPGRVTFQTYADVSTIGAAAVGAVAGQVVDNVEAFLHPMDFGRQGYSVPDQQISDYDSLFKRYRDWSQQVLARDGQ